METNIKLTKKEQKIIQEATTTIAIIMMQQMDKGVQTPTITVKVKAAKEVPPRFINFEINAGHE